MQSIGEGIRVNAQPEPEPAPALETGPRPPLIVLLGPTASGKTALGIDLARQFSGEIISADSRQIYREMDIGTAKPTPAERAAIPHHLLDLISPAATFGLAQYQRAAYAAISDLHGRDVLPFLVGGTGQYITAVIEGWGIPEVPPNTPLRTDLEDFAAEHGARALHDRLRDLDPAAADRIDYRNVRRVVRALEVCLTTGTPITVLQRKQPPPYRILQIGLPMPRDTLSQRIDARVDRMIADGLLDEVRRLLDAGYSWELPSMSGVGYAQWKPYIEGTASLDDVSTTIKNDTHAFARRQYTWFNGHDTGLRWFDITQIDSISGLVQDWLTAGKE